MSSYAAQNQEHKTSYTAQNQQHKSSYTAKKSTTDELQYSSKMVYIRDLF